MTQDRRRSHQRDGNRDNRGNRSGGRGRNSDPANRNSRGGGRGGNRDNGNRNLLPPPSVLQEYEYVAEGSVDRILAMAEVEQEHRHDWEAACFKAQVKSQRIGQVLGFILALLIIFVTWKLTLLGKETVAAALGGGAFIALALPAIISTNRGGGVFNRRGRRGGSRGGRHDNRRPNHHRNKGGNADSQDRKNEQSSD